MISPSASRMLFVLVPTTLIFANVFAGRIALKVQKIKDMGVGTLMKYFLYCGRGERQRLWFIAGVRRAIAASGGCVRELEGRITRTKSSG